MRLKLAWRVCQAPSLLGVNRQSPPPHHRRDFDCTAEAVRCGKGGGIWGWDCFIIYWIWSVNRIGIELERGMAVCNPVHTNAFYTNLDTSTCYCIQNNIRDPQLM